MTNALTIAQVRESFPEAFTKMKETVKEFHDEYLEAYLEKYGPIAWEKILNLHTKFYDNNGSLVAIEPRGALFHWNPTTSNWAHKGDLHLN